MRRKKGDPFKVFARREAGYGLSVAIRFEVHDGRGLLALGSRGRNDRKPSVDFEEHEIEADVLRAGRFVHVLNDGSRRSYALSRVTSERLAQISAEDWTELVPITEFGFRYMDLPEDALQGGADAAAIAVGPGAAVASGAHASAGSPTPKPRSSTPAPAGVRASRPKPVASTSSSTARPASVSRATSMPARGVAIAPALAESALARLDKKGAIEALKVEMEKVEALHQRVVALEEQLSASASREVDLIQLLDRWRSRELNE